jgi:hypothetical protein
MKRFFLMILAVSINVISGFGQDRLIKISKDTINCQIKEIGDDEIKYTQKEYKGDVIFGIDKNKVSLIIFSDGKELKIKDSMFDSAQYATQRKNALKVGFLSPLFGATSFTFEHSLKPGSSVEATLGIIGLGDDINGDSSSGMYLKFGYKFIKSPDFYLKGTRYAHILKGAYIRPEIALTTYSELPTIDNYYTSGSGAKENVTMFAIMLNTGKQWVVNDRFLFDWFIGAGYGFGDRKNSNAFHFAFLGGGSDSKFVMSSGIKIGILF